MSPYQPSPSANLKPVPVAGDLPCVSCGYNLTGLNYGDRCPECGTPIRRRNRVDDEPMTAAPLPYLRVLNGAALGAALGALLAPVSVFYAVGWSSPFAALVAGGSSALWAASIYVLTQPRPVLQERAAHVPTRVDKLRLATRVTQGAWPVFSVAVLLSYLLPAALVTPMSVVAWLLALVGVAGFVPTSICLADLADWARDTNLSGRLRGCAWFITFAMVYQLLVFALSPLGNILAGVLAIGQFFVNFALFGALVVFLFGVLQLASNTSWAIRNHKAAKAKEERDLARRDAEAQRRATELDRLAPGPTPAPGATGGRPSPFGDDPIPLDGDDASAPGARKPRPGDRTMRLDRPDGGADAYDLEPDEDR
ncbi:MAG: hypothetical protein EA378_09095 [Phycisphaerales bacterium]|nr:MAG: hypothetical protein EA378_09095 [Phycisphaerales bacterium]